MPDRQIYFQHFIRYYEARKDDDNNLLKQTCVKFILFSRCMFVDCYRVYSNRHVTRNGLS